MNGATTPIRPRVLRARLTASDRGTKPKSSAIDSTRSRVRAFTRSGRLSARETVEMLTPALAATS